MSEILKISEAASLALHTMVLLAAKPKEKFTNHWVAETLSVSEAHLSKVLQRLSKVGLVRSVRGPRGGYVINKPPSEITLLDVFEAMEGPLGDSGCLFGIQVCLGQCILGGLVEKVNKEVKEHLSKTYLDSLVGYFSCVSGDCCTK